MDENNYEYHRTITIDKKDYNLKKERVYSMWSVWRGAHQFPGQYTSTARAETGIKNYLSKKKAK